MADKRKAAMKRRSKREKAGRVQENFDLMVTRTKKKSPAMEAKRLREKNAATRKRKKQKRPGPKPRSFGGS